MSSDPIRVLAGDTGGTNTRLAVFEGGAAAAGPGPGALRLVVEGRYSSKAHAGLSEIVQRFLKEHGLRVDRGTFGIAGPVRGGRVRTTNLPWEVDANEVAATTGLSKVTLLNDLEANAWGLRVLGPSDVAEIQAGTPGVGGSAGNAALISAGTGLGEAGLIWDGTSHRPFACEGGHATFSPRTALDIALMEDLARQFGHVSWERVLSGPGVVNVHAFLLRHRRAAEPPWLADALRAGTASASISAAALAGTDEICSEALDLVVTYYGAEAGNLALKVMATGGLFLGGGVAPKILPRLVGPRFTAAFLDKGRMRPLLETMPVRVVTNDRTALLGAGWYAAFAQSAGIR